MPIAMSKYALDESSFRPPANKGRPGRPGSSASGPDGMRMVNIPEELRDFFKKYPSVSAAVKSGKPDVVKQLLEFLQTTPSYNPSEPSLILARMAGEMKPAVAQVLLDFGATLREEHEKMDPVFVAAQGKNTDLVMFFVEKGLVSPNHTRGAGITLLMVALRNESYDLADRLLKAGANVNQVTGLLDGGNAAIHYAASEGSFQSVIWLIENGADPTIENDNRKWACEVVPELADDSQMWNMDAMYETLKEYGNQYKAAKDANPAASVSFEIPLEMRKMAYWEHKPMTQDEAMQNAFSQMAEEKANQIEGVLPNKPKKMGF